MLQEAAKPGELDNFLKDFSHGANAVMRVACEEVIEA
jgi:hypothetical protein